MAPPLPDASQPSKTTHTGGPMSRSPISPPRLRRSAASRSWARSRRRASPGRGASPLDPQLGPLEAPGLLRAGELEREVEFVETAHGAATVRPRAAEPKSAMRREGSEESARFAAEYRTGDRTRSHEFYRRQESTPPAVPAVTPAGPTAGMLTADGPGVLARLRRASGRLALHE